MTLKAPKDMQEFGRTTEGKLLAMIGTALQARSVEFYLRSGDTDSRYNAEFGDCFISRSSDEAPIVCIELKGSTYPASFSLSDVEKRTTQCEWIVVDGSHGVWCVRTEDVMRESPGFPPQYMNMTVHGEGRDKYWACNIPVSERVPFSRMIDEIVARLK